MRTLMKVTVPVEAGNKAILDGRLPRVVQSTMERLQPEAAYFFTDAGKRTSIMVFNLNDPSDIPSIAEPFFMELNAEVSFVPAMNAQDLQTGLGKAAGKA